MLVYVQLKAVRRHLVDTPLEGGQPSPVWCHFRFYLWQSVTAGRTRRQDEKTGAPLLEQDSVEQIRTKLSPIIIIINTITTTTAFFFFLLLGNSSRAPCFCGSTCTNTRGPVVVVVVVVMRSPEFIGVVVWGGVTPQLGHAIEDVVKPNRKFSSSSW